MATLRKKGARGTDYHDQRLVLRHTAGQELIILTQSERLNIVIWNSSAYSSFMPVLPVLGFGVGLSPVMQWIVVPLLALWRAGRHRCAKPALTHGSAWDHCRLAPKITGPSNVGVAGYRAGAPCRRCCKRRSCPTSCCSGPGKRRRASTSASPGCTRPGEACGTLGPCDERRAVRLAGH